MKFSQNFAGISQNFSNLNANFDEPDNFRKMRKFCRKFAAYFWQAGSLQNYPPPRGVADINLNSPGQTTGRRLMYSFSAVQQKNSARRATEAAHGGGTPTLAGIESKDRIEIMK